ncbi:MAG: sigma-70 family RNA polymerase sigma factor, partial [Bacteroidota bacterium]
ISENQGILHKVASLYCDQAEERRDLFQEMVMQLWRAYGSFQGKAKISTWMYRIALNVAVSGFRKQKRRPEHQPLYEQLSNLPATPLDQEKEERHQLLYRAIDQLTKVEKAIVMLHLEDHSYEEIGQIMGITANYVGVKLNRIKAKLRKLLTPQFSEPKS